MSVPYEELFRWLDLAKDQGWYTPHTVRQIRTAVRRTQDAAPTGAYDDLLALRTALPTVFAAWQRKQNSSAATARSYESRMRSLISQFSAWSQDPEAYPGPGRGSKLATAKPAARRSRRTRRAPTRKKVASGRVAAKAEPAPRAGRAAAKTPAAPTKAEASSGASRSLSRDNISVEIRWKNGVTPAELASVLATLAECRPAAGSILLRAAANIFETG